MRSLRYYLDEDVNHGPTIARRLRERGIDAVTVSEVGRSGHGISDQDQLLYAGRERRVMVTEDIHFRSQLPHAGLVVMQRPLRNCLKRS